MTQGQRRNRSSYNARPHGRLSSARQENISQEKTQEQGGQQARPKQARPKQAHPAQTCRPQVTNEEHSQEYLMRLNKALASAGLCSRRQADSLIARGSVTVNGQMVTELGCKVNTLEDDISVDGRPLPRAQKNASLRYFLLHKPVQVVTTVHDPQGRQTVIDLLPKAVREQRLFPVGRLDFFSEGLLLLTNDGELTNRLTHPRWHLPKVYHVKVRGNVTHAKLDIMRRGMRLAEGELLAPVEVECLYGDASSSVLKLTLHQGINRQIRRMCRDLNLVVLRLARVAQGPLELGSLELGQSRALSNAEIRALRKSVGLPM